jgi:hypothetical protein
VDDEGVERVMRIVGNSSRNAQHYSQEQANKEQHNIIHECGSAVGSKQRVIIDR